MYLQYLTTKVIIVLIIICNIQKVLKQELGEQWSEQLQDFDSHPLAAASIGQVHRAILKDGTEVAMKIQVHVISGTSLLWALFWDRLKCPE